MNRFWMVYLDGGSAPTFQHLSRRAARDEAEILCKKTGKRAYVLEATETCALKAVEWTRLKEEEERP